MKTPFSVTTKLARASARSAATYNTVAQLPQTVGQRLLERLDYIVIQPKTVVEIGCGTGYLLPFLRKKFIDSHIMGLDISLPTLAQAAPPVFCADAHQLPFPDHSLDLVCSVFMLEWSASLPALLQEIKRVLAPEGLFLFATLGPGTLMELRKTWQQIDTFNHINFFSDMHDIGDLLLKFKFDDPVMDREDFTLLYRHTKTLLKELQQLGSIKVTPNIANTLTSKGTLSKLEALYPRDNEGYLPATFEVIYGHAFGTARSHLDDEQGISRIPISTIRKPRPSV